MTSYRTVAHFGRTTAASGRTTVQNNIIIMYILLGLGVEGIITLKIVALERVSLEPILLSRTIHVFYMFCCGLTMAAILHSCSL
jgi:hypothetical protein